MNNEDNYVLRKYLIQVSLIQARDKEYLFQVSRSPLGEISQLIQATSKKERKEERQKSCSRLKINKVIKCFRKS